MDPALQLEAKVLARGQACRDVIARGGSEVQRFYHDRVIFLTGGSGFLGKQLLEMILRSCQPQKVFILLRCKKGKNIQERVEQLAKDTVFDTLRQQKPDFADKIVPVAGDVGELRLGLNDADWDMLTKEVSVIFHVAATTRFDEHLRTATLINVRGSRECLALGKACTDLRSYVHVSTAYSQAKKNLIGQEIGEKFYKTPLQPADMIAMAEHMEEDRLTGITTGLIEDWRNTYTFTKALSEELIRTTSDGLPICVIRPAIVISSQSEPTPGWIDPSAIYSATGILAGVYTGVLHALLVDNALNIGFIPCDYVNNTVIAAGKQMASEQHKGGENTVIYSMTATKTNPIVWETCSKTLNTDGPRYASPLAVYYAFCCETKNRIMFFLLHLFFQLIPGYLVDFVCLLLGKERRFANISKKIYKLCTAQAYFLTNDWIFTDRNTRELYNSLSADDKIIYNFDVKKIDWPEMIMIWVLGVRKFIIKDKLNNAEYPVTKQSVMKSVHYIITPIYFYCLWKSFIFVIWLSITFISYFF